MTILSKGDCCRILEIDSEILTLRKVGGYWKEVEVLKKEKINIYEKAKQNANDTSNRL